MFIKTQLKIKKGGVLYSKIVKKTEIQSLGQKPKVHFGPLAEVLKDICGLSNY